jgi:muramidase (phage lysozyme)
MAHGFLQATDLRTERNFLGDIAGAIGNRIGKASNMARRERAYAESIAEKNNTSLSEAGIGRGHFFQRALGSTFGGDAIARTRGRFAKDATMSIDPTGSQASRFRGGFVDRGRYDYSDEIFSAPASPGGGLAGILSGGPSVAQKLLDAGPAAINPEVLGGEVAKYQGSPNTNAAGFTVDTTATEIKDIAGILNQIGQLMVRTNNSTIQAVDNVQRVNVKVVESIQSLGQLQVGIAERQIQNQRLLASNAENTAEKIASRQLAASEKANMAQQRASSGDLDPEGSGFEGPQGGGILGSMFGSLGNVLDTGLSLLGGRRGGRRGLGRMSRAGRRAQRAQGLYRAGGFNYRNNSMTGSALGFERIRQGKGLDGAHAASNDITKRYAQRYGEKAAIKRFGAEGLEAAGMSLTKGARVMRFLSPVLKRVPIVGGLLDFGISLALGEPVGRAAAKAIGATLGAGLGSFVPIPGVGTILGGIAGDLVGGAIYDALAGGSGGTETAGPTPFAAGGIITQPTNALMGEAGAEGVFPLEGAKGRKTFLQFGEGILEAQKQNKKLSAEIQARGLAEYFDKKPWWEKFLEGLKDILPNLNPFRRPNPPGPGGGGGGGNIDVSKLAGDTPEAKAWLAAINATEAGGKDRYNTLVGGEVVPELTQMTMQEVYDMAYGSSIGEGYLPERFGGRRVTYGADSHAAGAFQFHPATMMARVKQAGMDPNKTLFTPENQQKLALAHLMNLGVDPNKAMDSASLAKAGSMAGWQGLSVENGHITESGAMQLYAEMLQRANNGNANGMGDLNTDTTPLTPKQISDALEILGGDPDAPLNTPTITGPQAKGPLGDLLATSAQVDAQAKAFQYQPLAFSLPQMTASTGGNNGQQGFAFGLAAAGSSGMGTDPFSSLGIMSLK